MGLFVLNFIGNIFKYRLLRKEKWSVLSSEEEGEKTIVEKQAIELDEAKEKIKSHKDVAEIFKYFPEAKISSIKDNN